MASTSTHLLRFSRHESSSLIRAASFASSSSRHIARPQTRSFASSLPHLAPRDNATALSSLDLGARNTGRIAAKDENGNPIGREPGPLYREWLEGEGRVFKEVKPHETNYMGGSVPFPLNPSFKPPPPLSDRLRNLIFTKWMESPKTNNPRALSIRYGISIKRVEAIIRLKTHEHQLKQAGTPLQTAFSDAFESATGVYRGVPAHLLDSKTPPEQAKDRDSSLRDDAAAADYDADWEQLPEQDISRVYWEPIDEGAAPVVPAKLDEVAERKLAQRRAQPAPSSVQTVHQTTFIDIGDKFSHTNSKVKKTDPRFRGPLWKPGFASTAS